MFAELIVTSEAVSDLGWGWPAGSSTCAIVLRDCSSLLVSIFLFFCSMDAKDSFLSISITVGEECVHRRRCGVGASPGLTSWTILVRGKKRIRNVEVWEVRGKGLSSKKFKEMRKTLFHIRTRSKAMRRHTLYCAQINSLFACMIYRGRSYGWVLMLGVILSDDEQVLMSSDLLIADSEHRDASIFPPNSTCF